MVKLSALAFGLLTVVAQVSAQSTVKVMPFGASIVSVSPLTSIPLVRFTDPHPEMLARKSPEQAPYQQDYQLRLCWLTNRLLRWDQH